ncbi:MAG: delta-60 repeat domain-containing protein [Spirochaetota bacterium]
MKKKVFAVIMMCAIAGFIACGGGGGASVTNNDPGGEPTPPAGSLDTSFGVGGIVVTDFENGLDEAKAIAIQSDGKILVAGIANISGENNNFAIVRYNSDGTLDTSFGTEGKVTTNFGSLRNDQAYAMALQSDGKIIVAGYTNEGGNFNFALARYNTNGSLDTSFDSDGLVYTDLQTGSTDIAYAMAIQSDEKIVVAGYTITGSYNADIAIVRYNSDGSLDTGFGTNGIVITDINSNSKDYARSLAIQSNGYIVVGGDTAPSTSANSSFLLMRYKDDGTIDTSFNTNGYITTNMGTGIDSGNAVYIQSDGNIILAGYANDSSSASYDFAIARYTTNGLLDNSFGNSGKVLTHFDEAHRDDYGYSVVLDASGRILFAGATSVGTSDYDFALCRYAANGTVDTSFGTMGKVKIDLESTDDRGNAIAIQSDGKILVAGRTKISDTNTGAFALIRLWP